MAVAGLAPQNRGAGRSTCVQTARLEYMKRFGMAGILSYILIAGAGIRLGCRSSAKHGFCSASRTSSVRIQQGLTTLLNSRLGTHFAISCRNAWRRSASTVSQCTLRVIGEHVRVDAARGRAVDLRSDRPPGAYEAVRHGRDVFIAHHRGNQHSPGLPLISKTWRFCATGAACSRTPLREPLP